MEESSDIPILLAVKSNGILLARLFWPVDLDKGTVPDFLICYKRHSQILVETGILKWEVMC